MQFYEWNILRKVRVLIVKISGEKQRRLEKNFEIVVFNDHLIFKLIVLI